MVLGKAEHFDAPWRSISVSKALNERIGCKRSDQKKHEGQRSCVLERYITRDKYSVYVHVQLAYTAHIYMQYYVMRACRNFKFNSIRLHVRSGPGWTPSCCPFALPENEGVETRYRFLSESCSFHHAESESVEKNRIQAVRNLGKATHVRLGESNGERHPPLFPSFVTDTSGF